MNPRTTFLLAVALVVLASQPAHAIWNRSESVEWWINVSDTVTVMHVIETKALDPKNEFWLCQQVTCGKPVPLKGRETIDAVIQQDYWKGKEGIVGDQPLRAGDRVLVFKAHMDGEHESNVAYWLNLSKPDVMQSNHAAYDNDCKLLTDEKSIVDLAKSRIAAERPGTTRRRGLIVDFTNWHGDMSWDFVRTADPECKKMLVETLRQSKLVGERASAIANLASYPGADTAKLIRPYLNDPDSTEVQYYGSDRRTIRFYPARQAAYLALKILGDKIEEPKPYFKDVQAWDFEVGFENPLYFPYGDWMRLPRHTTD